MAKARRTISTVLAVVAASVVASPDGHATLADGGTPTSNSSPGLAWFLNPSGALSPGLARPMALSVPHFGSHFSPAVPGRTTRLRLDLPPGWTQQSCGSAAFHTPSTASAQFAAWTCSATVVDGGTEIVWTGAVPTPAPPADTRLVVSLVATPPVSEEPVSFGAAGSPAPGFWVEAVYTEGLQTIAQAWRAPNAAGVRKGIEAPGLVLAVNGSTAPPPPPCSAPPGAGPPGTQCLGVVVPNFELGEFVWTISGDRFVNLTNRQDRGAYTEFFGDIDPVLVHDTRLGGPKWSISGYVDEFSGGLSGRLLGWDPIVLSGLGSAAAVAGPVVQAALPQGSDVDLGLLQSRLLASAPVGHPPMDVRIGAALTARVAADTPPGTYSAVLTLTALS
ncbi:MAG: hypothetical protein ACT4QF_06980 [Sporichthyaceae bacterium]